MRALPAEDDLRTDEHLANLGTQCGDFALQCSDAAGFVNQVNRRIEADHGRLQALRASVAHLAGLQGEANEAAGEIRFVAAKAGGIITEGHATVLAALAEIGGLIDTVLGAAVQAARQQIDAGTIGRPLLGVAAVMSHGMEHWHPNPGFFFLPGGGPVFDLGPYYLSTLVTLLGPVATVAATGQQGFAERTVTAENSPIKGRTVPVKTPTTLQALLQFESGAQVTFLASWDVWKHSILPLEIHGTEGSLRVPDPNWFGGDIAIATGRGDWETTPTTDRVYGRINHPADDPQHANYRGLGLAEMARAIAEKRPHRASGDVALHVLAVMEAILEADASRRVLEIARRCDRPAAFGETEAAALLA